MIRRKNLLVWMLLVVFLLSTFAAGCGKTESPQGTAEKKEVIKLNLGHVFAQSSTQNKAAEFFAKTIKEKTNGQVQVAVFSDAQLGGDRELGEGLQRGTIDMAMVNAGPVAGFNEKLFLVYLPYVFNSFEMVDKLIFDGGWVGEKMKEYTKEIGIITLDFVDNSFRGFTNNKKPINNLADMKNMKVRVSENAVMIETFKAFGTLPTPMSVAELYTALQQGTVDAQDNGLNFTETHKYNEVQKYFTETNHMYSPALISINKDKWAALSPELQKAVQKAANETSKYHRDINRKDIADSRKRMQDMGMIINELSPEALAEFTNAGISVWPKFKDKLEPGMVDKLTAEAKAATGK